MHDSGFEAPLTDAALDREIEQLLAVEPSAGFAARVRQGAAAQEVTAVTWWWRVAAGGTLAAIAFALYVLWPDAPGGLPSVTVPAPSAPQVSAPLRPDVVEVPRGGRGTGVASAPRASGAPVRDTSPFVPITSEELQLPEVIIAPDERLAFALVLSPPVEPAPPAPEAAPRVADLPPLEDIEVAGVEIAPLRQIAALDIEGGRP